jgi:hypothetical protein
MLRLEFNGRDGAHTGRYFFWFAAPALLLAVGTFARLSSGRRWCKAMVAIAILGQLGLFATAWVAIVGGQRESVANYGRDPVQQMLIEVVKDHRVIASNQPQTTTWYCGLRSISLPADIDELERVNRDSPTSVDYLFIDMNMNSIQLDERWSRLVENNPRYPSPWKARIMSRYEYVFSPAQTRPIGYILLRRKGVPKSALELRYNP